MKLLLIYSQNYLQRYSTEIYNRNLRYASITMPVLKALIPENLNIDVSVIYKIVGNIDYNYPVDLASITAISATLLRAYEIADKFRKRKIPVVLEGVHPTLMPNEALKHADAIVKGYSEKTWSKLLDDFISGNMSYLKFRRYQYKIKK